MNQQINVRQARRDRGGRRVTVVTRVVTIGATALAVLAGVVFAQQATGSTTSTDTGGANDGTPSAPLPDTGSGGSWTPPAEAPGSGGAGSHSSSGGS